MNIRFSSGHENTNFKFFKERSYWLSLALARQNFHFLMNFPQLSQMFEVRQALRAPFFVISAFRKVLPAAATDSAFFQTIFFKIYRTVLLRLSSSPQKGRTGAKRELYRGTIYEFVRKFIHVENLKPRISMKIRDCEINIALAPSGLSRSCIFIAMYTRVCKRTWFKRPTAAEF